MSSTPSHKTSSGATRHQRRRRGDKGREPSGKPYKRPQKTTHRDDADKENVAPRGATYSLPPTRALDARDATPTAVVFDDLTSLFARHGEATRPGGANSGARSLPLGPWGLV